MGLENYDSSRQDREPGEAHGAGAWRFLTFPGDEDSVLDCHTLYALQTLSITTVLSHFASQSVWLPTGLPTPQRQHLPGEPPTLGGPPRELSY